MQKYDLRKVELDILSFFSMQEREGDTAKDIMLTKRISKAHVSKSVDNLKRRGYISLEEDKKDHRRLHISLTEEGHQVLKEFTKVRKQCKEILFQNITKEEMNQMIHVMEKMQRNVNEKLDGDQMQIVILNVTVQVEICIYCVFRMKKIIYSVLSPSPKRRIFMGLESNYSC